MYNTVQNIFKCTVSNFCSICYVTEWSFILRYENVIFDSQIVGDLKNCCWSFFSKTVVRCNYCVILKFRILHSPLYCTLSFMLLPRCETFLHCLLLIANIQLKKVSQCGWNFSTRYSVTRSTSWSDRDCCGNELQRTTPSGRTRTVCEKQSVPTCPGTILNELFTVNNTGWHKKTVVT